MILRRLFLPLLLLTLSLPWASAQVSVKLQLGRTSFIYGETIPLVVSVTNLTGTDLTFEGDLQTPWIDFIVNSTRGVPLTPIGQPTFGKVTIPSGRTLSRTVDLRKLFPLRELGNYSVYSIVKLPGQSGGSQSNRLLFNMSTAKPFWTQPVGVPGKPNVKHEYRVIRFTSGPKNQLYVQVADEKSKSVLSTHHLGEELGFGEPSVTVDGDLNLHVLYMVSPTFWGHAKVAPDGRFLSRDLYQPSAAGNPALAKNNLGEVILVGGIYYDAEEEARKRAAEKKASDRPDFGEE